MRKKQILSWLSVIVWMGVIYMFSAQDGAESSDMSNSVVAAVIAAFKIVHIEITNFALVSLIIRKLAHMFVYFVLALLVLNALATAELNFIRATLWTIVICFLYACSDELHQSFSPGRYMSFIDVIIDSCGAAFGIALRFMLDRIMRRSSSFR